MGSLASHFHYHVWFAIMKCEWMSHEKAHSKKILESPFLFEMRGKPIQDMMELGLGSVFGKVGMTGDWIVVCGGLLQRGSWVSASRFENFPADKCKLSQGLLEDFYCLVSSFSNSFMIPFNTI